MKRQWPSPTFLRETLRPPRPSRHPVRDRVDRATSIEDLRDIARRRVPGVAYDYMDGAAGSELSMARGRQAFRDVHFHPRVLTDVSSIDLTTTIGGAPSALPFGIAPIGLTRLLHHEGEAAGVRAAAAAGIPFALSTMSSVSLEDVAAAAPGARRWFQLYLWKDRAASVELMSRASEQGYDTLLLAVDTPVGGHRRRDVHNGMTIPPSFGIRDAARVATRPVWLANFLTTEPPAFASLKSFPGSVSDLITEMFDASLTFDDLTWLRSVWKGRLLVKGLQDPRDARRAVGLGADGVVVSSHGGRQLDRTTAPLRQLPAVRQVLDGTGAEVLVDSGVMSGADIVAALALGADFVLVGRAYLYGLMAGGEYGATRALTILEDDIRRTMQLLGVASVREITPDLVTLG
ncbi:alpha-hydroxy-acid oxidizing enzyme [Janibacter sp. Soil728]|uniref:alpha-hydroxy acid oxidase n=1 Tax=Janibacter sp. Soil728 TaxID=1736393 RepID=UPI0006F5C91E|nr:alpha-hydroxy acid oxidase [Janibacter sp. Soil728]KRE35962.1 alpha-hydroxy-acid oxidizing enzyme [Janibacter sp. Soil728]